MDQPALQVELPDSLRRFVDERVQRGDYTDAGEYLRDLVRRDREAQAAQCLRELIQEGLASGPARALGDADWSDLRASAVVQPVR
ncbi:MAG: type II toxin-antitoxin system ParD family antitoxin [Betaproteobacteria bacterium]